jgi:uncharacterized protein
MRSSHVHAPSMEARDGIDVSVVLAQADRQVIVALSVAPGTTVAEAVARSGLQPGEAGGAPAKLNCAIYGRWVPLSQPVANGDRIEILRPLLIEPKERRRRHATPLRR